MKVGDEIIFEEHLTFVKFIHNSIFEKENFLENLFEDNTILGSTIKTESELFTFV